MMGMMRNIYVCHCRVQGGTTKIVNDEEGKTITKPILSAVRKHTNTHGAPALRIVVHDMV
jgi:hypothetical protein